MQLLLLPLLPLLSLSFAPAAPSAPSTRLYKQFPSLSTKDSFSVAEAEFFEVGGEMWDPLSLSRLAAQFESETEQFHNMFPKQQFVRDAEVKHGRMSMLAWTGVWATSADPLGLDLHFPGAPVAEWDEALPAFLHASPPAFWAVLTFIAIAEGESVGHSGDNWRGMGTKQIPGDLGLYLWKNPRAMDPGRLEKWQLVEKKNGRAAMIAMASLFAWKALPGSVPIMDLLTHFKFERLRQRKIRKKMGMVKYFLCPWNRKQWDKMFPRHMAEASNALSAEELAELRKKAREEAKRLEELLIKNPETQEWRNYLKEKDKKVKIRWAKEKAEEDGEVPKERPKATVSERVARIERRREKFSRNSIKTNAR
ncbi:hypothetical protein TeGR_g922 [Tetraparma gracilis]|uniref:Uncharacterized protein n=1 Tax=Tetraparma gracilis TaxID=2962635 RepID=A0ABQ6MWC2_9STRA|nr:hypothetical protein TeGR_g922 [Tetraparma gracilis]